MDFLVLFKPWQESAKAIWQDPDAQATFASLPAALARYRYQCIRTMETHHKQTIESFTAAHWAQRVLSVMDNMDNQFLPRRTAAMLGVREDPPSARGHTNSTLVQPVGLDLDAFSAYGDDDGEGTEEEEYAAPELAHDRPEAAPSDLSARAAVDFPIVPDVVFKLAVGERSLFTMRTSLRPTQEEAYYENFRQLGPVHAPLPSTTAEPPPPLLLPHSAPKRVQKTASDWDDVKAKRGSSDFKPPL